MESVCTLTSTVGSNPTLSATKYFIINNLATRFELTVLFPQNRGFFPRIVTGENSPRGLPSAFPIPILQRENEECLFEVKRHQREFQSATAESQVPKVLSKLLSGSLRSPLSSFDRTLRTQSWYFRFAPGRIASRTRFAMA